MSKKDVVASAKAHAEPDIDSVFDFLYHDSRRIQSFLAQFDDSGVLTGIKQGETASRGGKRGTKLEVGGQVALLGGANLGIERGPSEAGAETMERSYDPFWTNARYFLDTIDERGLVHEDLPNATFGQFVKISGYLTVIDLVMFKEAWKLPTVQKMVRKGLPAATQQQQIGNRHQRRAQGQQPQSSQMDDANLMLELIQIMPHAVHAQILDAKADPMRTAWGALREEFMVTPASEMVLTHGRTIPGDWTMIGILNGGPDLGATHDQQLIESRQNLPPGIVDSVIGRVAETLAPMVRLSLGRPAGSYAMTPLLIFRQVT
jgi:hypothetical protein